MESLFQYQACNFLRPRCDLADDTSLLGVKYSSSNYPSVSMHRVFSQVCSTRIHSA